MSKSSTALFASDLARSVLRQASNEFAYSVFGYAPVRDTTRSQLGFNGVIRDRWTALYLLGNGHRGYSSVLMRFYSADSLSPFATGGINAYAYCEGDPVNYIDPHGRSRGPHRINLEFYSSAKIKALVNDTPHDGMLRLIKTNPRYRGVIEEITAANALNLALQLPDATIKPPHTLSITPSFDLGILTSSKDLITEIADEGKRLVKAAQQLIRQPSHQNLGQYELHLEGYVRGRKALIDHFRNELDSLRAS
ncbi:RHS repeat-associated core domain-containing protein [Pseudomonas sp. CAM1A]|uniref:RHS repeat-associated core domain-containing protein n=1 Tax=Pseudomonas sp. CAM1A TaxID=3231717 RepID=UPI0039C74C2B